MIINSFLYAYEQSHLSEKVRIIDFVLCKDGGHPSHRSVMNGSSSPIVTTAATGIIA
jgi:hypothetical protein